MGKVWEPLGDGKYLAENPKDSLEIEGEWLTVTELLFEGGDENRMTLIELPLDIHLCRAIAADEVSVTDEVLEAIVALVTIAENQGFSLTANRVRVWLNSFGKGEGDGATG